MNIRQLAFDIRAMIGEPEAMALGKCLARAIKGIDRGYRTQDHQYGENWDFHLSPYATGLCVQSHHYLLTSIESDNLTAELLAGP